MKSNFTTVETGKKAEDIAAEHLEMLGYRIIKRNFRIKTSEIDIIALDKDYLVFIEVRSKNETVCGHPFETISPGKQKKIISAARFFLMKNPEFSKHFCRFDAIALVKISDDKNCLIEHIKDAFQCT
ncbi:MAG: YraN family protein [Candidatus Riflebacteria bacterium]|nr:YraN family protein [Candidatus Riflebacteria bacterium]